VFGQVGEEADRVPYLRCESILISQIIVVVVVVVVALIHRLERGRLIALSV
jgi:hypothetical protein